MATAMAMVQRGTRPSNDEGLAGIEIRLLLEGVFLHRGIDLRGYEPSFLEEAVHTALQRERVATVSALQDRVLHDSECLERLLQLLSLGPTTLYSGPTFFRTFRRQALEPLRAQPAVKLWVAGCANGAEAYSLAILLREEKLHRHARVYATQMNGGELASARQGLLPAAAVKGCARNYRLAGGRESLPAYYSVDGDYARMAPSLVRSVVWAHYSLVTGASFNQFHCIVCRGVFGRFGHPLRERVHGLLYESLALGGLLGLDDAGYLDSAAYRTCYEPVDGTGQWYRKVS